MPLPGGNVIYLGGINVSSFGHSGHKSINVDFTLVVVVEYVVDSTVVTENRWISDQNRNRNKLAYFI